MRRNMDSMYRGIRERERGIWYLTPLSTKFQLYHGSQFYWWKENHQFSISH